MDGLAAENAQLKNLLSAQTFKPPSPPESPKEDKLLLPAPTAPALPGLDESSPLYGVIEMLRAQLMAQAAAQEGLLSQLGELRSSHAVLLANTSDVNDELILIKDKASKLAEEVEDERARREEAEKEKAQEADKVATLRQKMEESRRAIMRLQEEAAAKRNSDSRRSSLASLATPSPSVMGHGFESRRGSMNGFTFPSRRISLISGMESASKSSPLVSRGTPLMEKRRASLAGPTALALEAKRHSMAIENGHRRTSSALANMSPASSPGVGLGLDFEHQPPPRPLRSASRRPSALGRPSVDGGAENSKEELRAMVLKVAAHEESVSNESPSFGRRQSNSLLCTQIDEQVPGIREARRPLRMSMDLGDSRAPLPPRAGSWTVGSKMMSDQRDSAEVMLLRAQLSAAQNKLAEVEEAKHASETCLHALKEFISTSGQAGPTEQIKLPPLPTEDTSDEEEKTVPVSVSRRQSLWSLATFVKSVDSTPTKQAPSPSYPKEPKGSPPLTEFNGWSARRRASHVAKEKTVGPPPRPTLASFESFSFQSRTLASDILDSPGSPGGGSLEPVHRDAGAASELHPLAPTRTPCEGSGRFPSLAKFEEATVGQAL